MKTSRYLFAAALAAAFGAAQAQDPGSADARYIARIESRFAAFAGSSANLQSLALGLRHGEAIVLTETVEPAPAPPPGTTPVPPATEPVPPPAPVSTTIVPPTRPMGYGNVTRTLDLASRQLSALGITAPTPGDISAALNGGTVTTATGDVTLQGVLQLRGGGMGWGQIARAIGVHPGMGSAKALPPRAPVPPSGTGGITTAAGGAVAPAGDQGRISTPAMGRGGVTNAAGAPGQSRAAGLHTPKGHANGHAGSGKGAGRS